MRLPSRNPDVVFRRVRDGAVLVGAESCYGLNVVGAWVWQQLPPVSTTFQELSFKLANRHPDMDSAAVRTNLSNLLLDLLARRFVLSQRPLSPVG